MFKKLNRLPRLMLLRARKLSRRNMVLVLSVVTGIGAGLSAVVLKNSVYLIRLIINGNYPEPIQFILNFLCPLLGIGLVGLMGHYVTRETIIPGVPQVLHALAKKRGQVNLKTLYHSIFGAAITSGFGGSAGLEGPTVSAAGTIGSQIAQAAKLDYKTTTLLIACGAAGSMSGLFNAPIAAVIFALEVMALDLTLTSMVPLLLASVAASLAAQLMLGQSYLFHIDLLQKIKAIELPWFLLLGLGSGLGAVYFTRTFWAVEKLLSWFKAGTRRRIAGGLMLGLLIFLIPALYGEGYQTVNSLLKGNVNEIFEGSILLSVNKTVWLTLFVLFLLSVFKVVAASLTIHAGGVGGIFAPALFTGAISGFLFASAVNATGITELNTTHYALVGTCGMISGTMHAPLTAIFLIAEISGGYELFLPLMMTSALAYFIHKRYNVQNIFTRLLASRGELLTHHTDNKLLVMMQLEKEIETNFSVLRTGQMLGDLVDAVKTSSRNLFPVVDENGILMGVIQLDEVKDSLFDFVRYKEIPVENLMITSPELIYEDENLETVMKKLNRTGAWNLPVVTKEGKYLGFISKSRLLSDYRDLLLHFSEE